MSLTTAPAAAAPAIAKKPGGIGRAREFGILAALVPVSYTHLRAHET